MKDILEGLLWVVLGSAVGGPARYFVSGVIGRHIGETFPWGTMVINVSGAFAVGLLGAAAFVCDRARVAPPSPECESADEGRELPAAAPP